MSVIVKGVKKPDSCAVCRFAGKGGYHIERVVCMFTGKNEDAKNVDRLSDCPLIALPDKHGRLGDLDALIHELNNSHYPGAPYVDAGISIAIGKVCDAPTIVEEEGSE